MRSDSMLKKTVLLSLLSFGLLSGAANAAEVSAAEGQPGLQGFALEEIVVTATATPTNRIKTGASMTVISGQEIEEKQWKSLYEILEHVAGVDTRLYGNGVGYEISAYSEPQIRGRNALILIDGVNQSQGGLTARMGLADVNPKDIDRIEVLKGSASVLYGANAVGGVINIITKRAGQQNKTSVKTEAGNFGYRSYNINTRGSADKFFWAANAEKRRKGDFKDGGGYLHRTHKASNIVDLKLGYKVNDKLDLILKYDTQHSDLRWRYDYTKDYKQYDWSAIGSGYFNSNRLTFIADYNDKLRDEGNKFYAIKTSVDAPRTYANYVATGATRGDRWNYSSIRIGDTWHKRLGKQHRLTVGGEYSRYKNRDLAVDNSMRETSFYVQDEWDFAKNLRLTSGLRYVVPGDFGKKLLSSFNLLYTPSDKLGIYAARTEYYIQPNLSYVYGTGSSPVYTYLPNHDLKPSAGRTIETGINYQPDKKTFLNFNIFKRDESDSFAIKDLGNNVRQYVNIDTEKTVYKGMELSVNHKFGNGFSGKVSYYRTWWNHPVYLSTAQYWKPKSTWTIDLGYEKSKLNLGVTGVGRYELNDQAKANGRSYRMLLHDSFWVWNMYVNYRPTKNIKVFARINNLFDKEYNNVGMATGALGGVSFINTCNEGRSFVAGLEYEF